MNYTDSEILKYRQRKLNYNIGAVKGWDKGMRLSSMSWENYLYKERHCLWENSQQTHHQKRKGKEERKMDTATEAPKAPVTRERRVRNDLEEKIPKPCKFLLSISFLFLLLSIFITCKTTHIYILWWSISFTMCFRMECPQTFYLPIFSNSTL